MYPTLLPVVGQSSIGYLFGITRKFETISNANQCHNLHKVDKSVESSSYPCHQNRGQNVGKYDLVPHSIIFSLG